MSQAATAIAKVNPWHQRFAEWLILHGNAPGWQGRAAAHFKVTQAWLSQVYNSDAFQDHFTRLSHGHSEALLHTIRDKVHGAADQAISELAKRLEESPETFNNNLLVETTDTLLRRAGYGLAERAATPGGVVVNLGLVTKTDLENARQQMRVVPAPVELKAIEVIPPAGAGVPSSSNSSPES